MFQKNKTRKMSLSRALDKYLKIVSVHKKGHLQEFYRVNVIKRHPMADRYMDEITTIDIAGYRDQRCLLYTSPSPRDISGSRNASCACKSGGGG
ncbi:hypothetical protein ACX3V1_15190, partial [Escherichia coli]